MIFFPKHGDNDIYFVEIGIYRGGSLKMWKEYFGPKIMIYGIDKNPVCKKYKYNKRNYKRYTV